MYAFIRGQLIDNEGPHVVVETGGVGFTLFLTTSTLTSLPPLGSIVTFFIAPIFREDTQELYGFTHKEEKKLFQQLLHLPGIGPKTALHLISHLGVDGLQQAVATQDLKTLCRVPGIGKKSAERLVVELKDKIDSFIPTGTHTLYTDALKALVQLGRSQADAQRALQKTLDKDPPETLSALITAALRQM